MQIQKGQSVDMEISAMAFGGSGIGRYEGMAVFVEGTVPGDKVQASFTRIKKKFGEAKLVKIIKTSPDRVTARCPYSGVCGGCHFQYLKYEKQLEIKHQHTIDALERIGKFANPPVAEIIACDDPFYYRNKMEFSFGYDGGMNFALGFHIPGRRFDILDVKECYLESEFSVKILNKTREFALAKKWLPRKYGPDDSSEISGFLKSLFVREGKRTGEVMVNVLTSVQVPENFKKEMEELANELLKLEDKKMKIVSIYWSRKIAKRGQVTKIEEDLIYGKATFEEKMILANGDELTFEILPQAFFQVNTLQAEKLYMEVVKLVEDGGHKIAFDLFCGTGTIGLFLAKHVENVIGVEVNPDSVKMALENARKNKIFNIDFFTGDVADVLKKIKQTPSLVLVDPPRAGLSQKMIERMADLKARKIIYVSCNPATLARDCEYLGKFGYKIKSVQPVDMFPHSYHVENVCLLER